MNLKNKKPHILCCAKLLSDPIPKLHVLMLPLSLVAGSVADPGHFDADPDPTFQADADPDPKFC